MPWALRFGAAHTYLGISGSLVGYQCLSEILDTWLSLFPSHLFPAPTTPGPGRMGLSPPFLFIISSPHPPLEQQAPRPGCYWMKSVSSMIMENFQDMSPSVLVSGMLKNFESHLPLYKVCFSKLLFCCKILFWMSETSFSLHPDRASLTLTQHLLRETNSSNSGRRTRRIFCPQKCKKVKEH